MHSVATPSALPWAAGRAILPAWIRVVAAVALAKAVIGWGGIPGALETAPAWRVAMFAAHVGVFGAAGVTLHLLGRRDARAVSLGLFFLVLSGAWADRLLEAVADSPGTLGAAALLLRHLQVIAFAPFFFWLFILDFPRRRGFHRHSRLVTAAVAASLGVAAFLLVANLLLVAPIDPWLTEQARAFDRGRLGTLFWPLVFAVGTPAIPYAGWQARSAAPDERRRVHLLLLGLLGGVAPEMVITSIASAWPGFAEFVRSPEGRRFVGAIVYPPMLAIPFLTGYAVVVHRALDVRFLVRRVVQYALARYTLVLATTLPFLAAFWLVYSRREQTIADLWSSPGGLLLAAVAGAGGLALRVRPMAVATLDRRFFREQYDAREVLSSLIGRIQALRDPADLATLLESEIDRALHLHRVAFLVLDRGRGRLVSPQGTAPPLPLDAHLVRHLASAGTVEVEWDRPPRWLASLPEEERRWLADAGFRLLIPVAGESLPVVALIGLGEKRSELPFSGEDRLLLSTIAGSVMLAVRRHGVAAPWMEEPGAPEAALELAAAECAECGVLALPGTAACERCGGGMAMSPVPLLLAGKFRLIERIGRGGMGVVYRALDLDLDRIVAVKTLPQVTVEETVRLRREARAMASVMHPNLALIMGAESWRGAPVLVVEHLPGGTLADRLARGPLPLDEALELGIALAPALARLHGAGILHRDIKPSNIGFAADGTPKLLDFGVAQVIEASHPHEGQLPSWMPATPRARHPGPATRGEMTGTLAYLSPEAVSGAEPGPDLDLWALSLVLYEAVSGHHPFADVPWPWVLVRITETEVPDLREHAEVPAAVADYFRSALAHDRWRRPSSARELEARLRALLGSTSLRVAS